MIFTTINGDQYTIPIDLEKINNYSWSSFNNYVLEYLSTQDLTQGLKEKLDDTESYIKYIYGEKIINSDNYSYFINTDFTKSVISSSSFLSESPSSFSTSGSFLTSTGTGGVEAPPVGGVSGAGGNKGNSSPVGAGAPGFGGNAASCSLI